MIRLLLTSPDGWAVVSVDGQRYLSGPPHGEAYRYWLDRRWEPNAAFVPEPDETRLPDWEALVELLRQRRLQDWTRRGRSEWVSRHGVGVLVPLDDPDGLRVSIPLPDDLGPPPPPGATTQTLASVTIPWEIIEQALGVHAELVRS